MQFAEVYMEQSSQTICCAINQASISFKRLKSYRVFPDHYILEISNKGKKLGDFRRQSDTLNMGQNITREIRKYLEMNENENTKTWDAAKIFVRDQFIAVNIYIFKKEHIKSINFCLKLEKEDQSEP